MNVKNSFRVGLSWICGPIHFSSIDASAPMPGNGQWTNNHCLLCQEPQDTFNQACYKIIIKWVTPVLVFVDDQIPDYERMSNKLFPLFQMKNTRTIITGGVCIPGVDNVRGFYINSFEFRPSILTCSGQSSLILATIKCPIWWYTTFIAAPGVAWVWQSASQGSIP